MVEMCSKLLHILGHGLAVQLQVGQPRARRRSETAVPIRTLDAATRFAVGVSHMVRAADLWHRRSNPPP